LHADARLKAITGSACGGTTISSLSQTSKTPIVSSCLIISALLYTGYKIYKSFNSNNEEISALTRRVSRSEIITESQQNYINFSTKQFEINENKYGQGIAAERQGNNSLSNKIIFKA